MELDSHAVALLIVRLGLAAVYLSAALIHSKDLQGWKSALHFTALLFKTTVGDRHSAIIKVCAAVAVAVLYLSGLGVLLGLEARPAAAAMLVVAACGFLMHMRESKLAVEVANGLERAVGKTVAVERMKFSAEVGNASSAIKNIAIVAAAASIMIEGPGLYSVSAAVGMPSLW